MHLFRIEHKTHETGPYNTTAFGDDVTDEARDELNEMTWRHGDWEDSGSEDGKHPVPEYDGIGYLSRGEERSAFASLDQLRAWFTAGELRTMEACGFVLVELLCGDDAVRVGRKQVAYDPSKAVRMSKRMPTEAIA